MVPAVRFDRNHVHAYADVIVADRTTLTGSIGVFGMFINPIDALKNKLGVTLDGVKSNASAGMGSVSALTPVERASIMRGVDKVYTTFTNDVAEGRNLPIEKVLDIAGGRVWSGADALGIGLIDTYGGLKTAIAIAADKAELGDKFRIVEMTEAPTGFGAFFSGFMAKVKANIVAGELGPWAGEWRKIREAVGQQGVVMYCPYAVQPEM